MEANPKFTNKEVKASSLSTEKNDSVSFFLKTLSFLSNKMFLSLDNLYATSGH